MSYKRDPSDPDHSKNIEKAGEGFAWLRALREEKGNQLAHSLQTIYDNFPEHNASDTVLLEKNPAQYLLDRHRPFFEAMQVSLYNLIISPWLEPIHLSFKS